MEKEITNMRIHFYGVQGSASTFPTIDERDTIQELMDYELLMRVFQDLEQHLDNNGRLGCSLEEVLGGSLNRETLMAYRHRFTVPEPRIYGGWTTSVLIETAEGNDIVFDCGSGFRNCAKDLQEKWGDKEERHLHIFGTHSHWDHTEGFDQAAVCFDARNTLHIYGNYQFLYALDAFLGIFSKFVHNDVRGVQTPITFSSMLASIQGIEIVDPICTLPRRQGHEMTLGTHEIGVPVEIGSTRITAFRVFHPAPCFAYRVERGGKTFIFCTDHELRHGPDSSDPKQKESEEADQGVWEQCRGADVVYHDGQYLRTDYDGVTAIGSSTSVSRLNWGHSCIEDVREMTIQCAVKHVLIGHHDPNREWSELNWIDNTLARACEGQDYTIELARAGMILDI
ncbi:MBL fold metallo-hydrolase [Thermodesulfobacteriota bacterium]